VPPEEVEGLRGSQLRDKVLRYPREYAPRWLDITYDWFVYAECDRRLILRPQVLTAATTYLPLSCGQ
jgi:hypothetical protein